MAQDFEFEDIFARDEAKRRRERVEAARELNAVRAAQEAQQEAARRATATAYTMEVNERIRLAEYRAAGVEPPTVDGVAVRTSLTLLLSLGWSITQIGERNVLLRPDQYGGQRAPADQDRNT